MKLWRDNRIDGEWEIDPSTIAEGFWKSRQGRRLLEYEVRMENCLLDYMGSDDGLNSTFDISEQPKEWNAVLHEVLGTWPKAVNQ